jgi:hypothetical protein
LQPIEIFIDFVRRKTERRFGASLEAPFVAGPSVRLRRTCVMLDQFARADVEVSTAGALWVANSCSSGQIALVPTQYAEFVEKAAVTARTTLETLCAAHPGLAAFCLELGIAAR